MVLPEAGEILVSPQHLLGCLHVFVGVPDPGTKGAQEPRSEQSWQQHFRDTMPNRRLLVAATLPAEQLSDVDCLQCQLPLLTRTQQ